jgi:GT2 family glycosyltransferase
MDKMNTPPITVLICTRNRGDCIVNTIRTILLNDYPNFELMIVDQSEDDLTESSLQPFIGNPRVRYLRTATKGLSVARNLAITTTQSEFIATTDDDCETSTNWLKELVAAFALDNRIGIVFGNVLSGPHDPNTGFISSYVRHEPFLARNIFEKHRVEGISACMGLRRTVWQRIGGFDEMFGVGAPFKAAEELDFTIQALRTGYFVYETPNVTVIHHGFRTWEQGKTLIKGYLYGIGAMFAKHLKCGHWSIIQVLLHLAWRWAFEHPVVDFGHRPSRWLRLNAFVRGFLIGLYYPVNEKSGHSRNNRSRSEHI